MVVPIIIGGAIALEELIPLVIAASAVLIYTDQARKKSPTVSRPKPIELPSKSEKIERITGTEQIALRKTATALIQKKLERDRCRNKCNCPPETFKRVKKETKDRSGMSELSLDYQSAICGSKWYPQKKNDKTSKNIIEWVYFKGPGNPPVEFDGWIPRFCLFLEAKARYDHLFKEEKGRIVVASWASNLQREIETQASRQDHVCSTNKPAKCCWVWMTIKAYQYFNSIKQNYPNLYSIYVPLSK